MLYRDNVQPLGGIIEAEENPIVPIAYRAHAGEVPTELLGQAVRIRGQRSST